MRQQLFNFIHALSKQEKRYFKLYSSQLGGEDGNMYTHLFDIIEASDSEDEELIRKKYGEMFDLKTYIHTKFYLKTKLLETLRLMQEHITASPEQEIKQLMENANLFYQKGFASLCEKEIIRAEKLAEESENWCLLYDIIEKKITMFYDIFTNSKDAGLETLDEMIEKKKNALRLLEEHSSILDVMHIVKFRLKKWNFERDKDYMEQLLQLDILQQTPKSILSQITFYTTRAIISKYLQKNENYYSNYQKVFEIWQKDNIVKSFNIKGYLISCSNYITAMVINKKIAEAEKILAQVQQEYPQLRKRLLNPQDIEPPFLHVQKVVYLHTANYTALIGIEKKLSPFLLPGNPYFPKTTIAELHYALGYAYFRTFNYDKSLQHLNQVMTNKELLSQCTHFYIYCFTSIYLLCHYELNNIKFLSYEIEKQRDFANKLDANNDVFNTVFKLLKKLCKYPETKQSVLLKYLPVFQEYETENPNSVPFISMTTWIQGQLSRRY